MFLNQFYNPNNDVCVPEVGVPEVGTQYTNGFKKEIHGHSISNLLSDLAQKMQNDWNDEVRSNHKSVPRNCNKPFIAH